jgi:hypothetical protein
MKLITNFVSCHPKIVSLSIYNRYVQAPVDFQYWHHAEELVGGGGVRT